MFGARDRRLHLAFALLLGLGFAATAWGQGMAVLVKDINPATTDDDPYIIADLVAAGRRLFFVADDAVHGRELWTSDGTSAGTTMVRDINPAAGSEPHWLTAVGGVLYFAADDGTAGVELWRSDGTAAGTVMVRDINPAGDSGPRAFADLGGLVLFGASDATRSGLWRTDGTHDGTVRIADVVPFSGPYGQPNRAILDGFLFFSGLATGSVELWKTDGTPGGTSRVRDINPGVASSDPEHLRVVGGRVVFRADDGSTGLELWRSDGTEEGTLQLKDINPTGGSYPSFFGDAPGLVFFAAGDGMHSGLWRTDGTREGTTKVADVALSRAGAAEAFTFPAWANGRLFFAGWDLSAVGLELWTSDGTPAGTGLLKDINPSGDSYPTWPIPVGNAVYFDANDDGTFGRELWRSNGTPEGTVMVANLNRDGGSYPISLTNVAGTLFFTADDGVNGRALWAWLPCGDGQVDPGEQCDDGNRTDGDCCSASCTFETAACNDGDGCTTGDVCRAGTCVPGIAVTCGLCEQCDPAAGCVGAPRAGCRRPTRPKATLSLKAGRGERPGSLAWSWRRGTGTSVAEFGDPAGSDAYALCLYDRPAGVPRLLVRADAPAGGTCGKRRCWRARGRTGFRYRNTGGAPDGLVAIDLRAGGPGQASIEVTGGGPNLMLPALPVDPPVSVQLQATNGSCWEASYAAESLRRNTSTRLQGRGR